jgi:hypothetical protein
MTLFADEIQPGWRVVDADGEELGTVISVDRESISIQSRGLVGGVWHVPREYVAEAETGRIELRLTKQQLT